MSARWKLDLGDLASTARHIVLPVVGYGVLEGLQRADLAGLDMSSGEKLVYGALLSGVIRLLSRWLRRGAG